MKKSILLFVIILLSGSLLAQTSQTMKIVTQNSELVYAVGKNQMVNQVYYGEKLNRDIDWSVKTKNIHEIYAPFGITNFFEPAIRTTHNDGNPSLDLKFAGTDVKIINENVTETTIQLKDAVYPFDVNIHIKAYFKEDVLQQWTEIVHHEKKPVTIFNYASSMLHFDADSYWLTQFHGDWAQEMRMEENKLTSGIKVIDSKLGTRADVYQTPFFVLSLNKPSDENTGEAVAGTLEWTGNFKFTFEINNFNSLRIISGINSFASEYRLMPGKVFMTPAFVFAYSHSGKEAVSQNLHNWVRKYALTDGDKPRMTLLNNWETTFCDFDEPKLNSLIKDAKKLDLDLFLLDDGWFGNKYPRNDDHTSLGDWELNKTKLPNGLGALVKEATAQGVKFGIWIEPEMVNPKSELYENHPDWVLKLTNRPEDCKRNQLVLDLTNPKVQEFVFGVLDNLMQNNPGIAYIKWDCNRFMTSSYSQYLKENQSHLFIEYVRSFYQVLDRVRAKYPHLPIMLCSAGGGRIDYGALRYFNEFWPSDNTDPFERVFIQWGFSYYMPAIAMCNHITSAGKQSIKFKTDVAMMGKMGFDLKISQLNDKELKFCQDAVQLYKRINEVIWFGNISRLVSPYENNRAVVMFSNQAKTKAILFNYTLNARTNEIFSQVKLRGLNASKNYKVEEVNLFPGTISNFDYNGKILSGDYLMKVGLLVSSNQALSSSVFEITQM